MCNVIKSTSKDGGVVCTHCHNSASCVLLHVDMVDLHATHGQLEHAREWLDCQCKQKRREWASLSNTSFSPEWLRHRLRANDTQCEAPCCGHQPLQANAITVYAEQHVFKVVMVYLVICLRPVKQEEDNSKSEWLDEGVDQYKVDKVCGWDEWTV